MFRWAVRVLAIGAGVRIEYQQVFEVSKAQPILVGLGLWLMAVPPAMWADQLRRFIPGRDGEVEDDEDSKHPEP